LRSGPSLKSTGPSLGRIGVRPLRGAEAKLDNPEPEDARFSARLEAEAWRVRLDAETLPESTRQAFRSWRRNALNAAAFADAERAAQIRGVMVATRAQAAARRRGSQPSC
jgi:ferric-dicitrate binding protein FerR (iron transport regulator)